MTVTVRRWDWWEPCHTCTSHVPTPKALHQGSLTVPRLCSLNSIPPSSMMKGLNDSIPGRNSFKLCQNIRTYWGHPKTEGLTAQCQLVRHMEISLSKVSSGPPYPAASQGCTVTVPKPDIHLYRLVGKPIILNIVKEKNSRQTVFLVCSIIRKSSSV